MFCSSEFELSWLFFRRRAIGGLRLSCGCERSCICKVSFLLYTLPHPAEQRKVLRILWSESTCLFKFPFRHLWSPPNFCWHPRYGQGRGFLELKSSKPKRSKSKCSKSKPSELKGEWVNFWFGTPLSDRLLIPVVDARIAVTADIPFDAGTDTSSAEVVMAYPRCFSVSRGQLVALSSASLASDGG